MHYLFLGEDSLAKDRKITEIKNKFLSSKEALKLDCEVLSAIKLAPAALKKSLLALPAVVSKKVIIIRAISKLDARNKELILDFLQTKPSHFVLVLDDIGNDRNNSFIKKLTPYVETAYFGGGIKQNVFDMTKRMSARDPQQALQILSNLLVGGDHPLQILGALVWFWGKKQSQVTADKFKKGLMMLKEADVNIKRSRLKPEHALEIVVVKLCLLIT